jgi:hypothetical protein
MDVNSDRIYWEWFALHNSLGYATVSLFMTVLRQFNFFATSYGVVSAVGGRSDNTGAGDVTCGK